MRVHSKFRGVPLPQLPLRSVGGGQCVLEDTGWLHLIKFASVGLRKLSTAQSREPREPAEPPSRSLDATHPLQDLPRSHHHVVRATMQRLQGMHGCQIRRDCAWTTIDQACRSRRR